MDDADDESPEPKKILETDFCDYWKTQSEDNTQICVGIITDEPMTKDEFIAALQYFIDEVIENDLEFLDPVQNLNQH